MPSKGHKSDSPYKWEESIHIRNRPQPPFYTGEEKTTSPTGAPPPVSKKNPPDPEDKKWVRPTDPSYVSNFRNNPVGDFGFKR